MKKSFIAIIFLSMTVLGAVSGGAFYLLFMSRKDSLIFHCIGMGIVFGLLNALVTLFFIKKNNIINSNNERLGREIRIDKLTELYNRYAYGNDIKNHKPDGFYSMIYIDIDDFGRFNNLYGHDTGDKVLKICADIIKNCIRYSDKAYRYGGDELVVILDGCTKKEAIEICQRIVENIHNYDNAPFSQISISAGVASMPDDAQTFDQLIKASDSALLNAKKEGKNKLSTVNINLA